MGSTKLNKAKDKGWAFLDVLIGLFLTCIILISVFGNIAVATNAGARTTQKVKEIIDEQNETLKNKKIEFFAEIFKK